MTDEDSLRIRKLELEIEALRAKISWHQRILSYFAGLIFRLKKDRLKFDAYRKLILKAKFFRLIYGWLRRKFKTFGKRGKRLIFPEINFPSFRAKYY